MRAIITACTERIFAKELMPLAHLTFGEVCAVNDNELRFAVRPAICPHHQLGRKAGEASTPRIQDHSAPSTTIAAAVVTAVGTPIAWESGPASIIR